jgi:hypothetical protein
VFRNLINVFAVLPEICSTSLAGLGSFRSSLSTLGQPTAVKFDDDDGDWAFTWQDVVLGDANAPHVYLQLVVRFETPSLLVLQAVPFTLVPQSTLQLVGQPPSYAAGNTEGFFLFQDAVTGVWTLRWRALGERKVFAGRVFSDSGITRVIKRVLPEVNELAEDPDKNAVVSLQISDSAGEVSFEEFTDPIAEKGLTFFVRPGDQIRMRLQIGPSSDDLTSVTAEQVRVGAADQTLPLVADAEEFSLVSNLPGNPVATEQQVGLTPGTDAGTFIWQDVETNGCNPGEDQWRLRFLRRGEQTNFSGNFHSLDNDAATLHVTALGACPAGSLSDSERNLEYDCTLTDDTPSGYDICLLTGNRLTFSPAIDELSDPGLVFIGAKDAAGKRALPPSPDPFIIRVDVTLQELQSDTNLLIDDTMLLIRGNNDEEGSFQLNPDQVSRDPLCHLPGETVLPRVRLNGDGDYSTARATGSAFELDDVEFLETGVTSLDTPQRLPDLGELLLLTRVEEEIENSEATVFMQEITTVNGRTQAPANFIINVQEVKVTFPDLAVTLAVE